MVLAAIGMIIVPSAAERPRSPVTVSTLHCERVAQTAAKNVNSGHAPGPDVIIFFIQVLLVIVLLRTCGNK